MVDDLRVGVLVNVQTQQAKERLSEITSVFDTLKKKVIETETAFPKAFKSLSVHSKESFESLSKNSKEAFTAMEVNLGFGLDKSLDRFKLFNTRVNEMPFKPMLKGFIEGFDVAILKVEQLTMALGTVGSAMEATKMVSSGVVGTGFTGGLASSAVSPHVARGVVTPIPVSGGRQYSRASIEKFSELDAIKRERRGLTETSDLAHTNKKNAVRLSGLKNENLERERSTKEREALKTRGYQERTASFRSNRSIESNFKKQEASHSYGERIRYNKEMSKFNRSNLYETEMIRGAAKRANRVKDNAVFGKSGDGSGNSGRRGFFSRASSAFIRPVITAYAISRISDFLFKGGLELEKSYGFLNSFDVDPKKRNGYWRDNSNVVSTQAVSKRMAAKYGYKEKDVADASVSLRRAGLTGDNLRSDVSSFVLLNRLSNNNNLEASLGTKMEYYFTGLGLNTKGMKGHANLRSDTAKKSIFSLTAIANKFNTTPSQLVGALKEVTPIVSLLTEKKKGEGYEAFMNRRLFSVSQMAYSVAQLQAKGYHGNSAGTAARSIYSKSLKVRLSKKITDFTGWSQEKFDDEYTHIGSFIPNVFNAIKSKHGSNSLDILKKFVLMFQIRQGTKGVVMGGGSVLNRGDFDKMLEDFKNMPSAIMGNYDMQFKRSNSIFNIIKSELPMALIRAIPLGSLTKANDWVMNRYTVDTEAVSKNNRKLSPMALANLVAKKEFSVEGNMRRDIGSLALATVGGFYTIKKVIGAIKHLSSLKALSKMAASEQGVIKEMILKERFAATSRMGYAGRMGGFFGWAGMGMGGMEIYQQWKKDKTISGLGVGEVALGFGMTGIGGKALGFGARALGAGASALGGSALGMVGLEGLAGAAGGAASMALGVGELALLAAAIYKLVDFFKEKDFTPEGQAYFDAMHDASSGGFFDRAEKTIHQMSESELFGGKEAKHFNPLLGLLGSH